MSFVKFPSVEPFFIRIHNVGKTGMILIFFNVASSLLKMEVTIL